MATLTDKGGREIQQEAAGVARCIFEGAGLTGAALIRLTREIQELRNDLESAAAKADGQGYLEKV